MTDGALVTLKDITKKYGSRAVLTDISLSIKHGECILLRGRNGSGKSTLLRIVTGLIPVTTGERLLDNSQLIIGYTPDQLPRLRLTSTEYLTHMGRISGMPAKELANRIKALHAFFNLEQSSKLKMTHFSKGMLQKVNLMQATLKTPNLLVLDEPFSGLDAESIQHLLDSLKRIKAEGTSILAAVHDPLLANQLEGRTYWIRQGKLIEEKGEQPQNSLAPHFELECILSEEELSHVSNQFPDVTWITDEHGRITFTILKNDYRDFLLEFINNDFEIISLQRKEMNA
ncbi:ATP-binding cassette domain-containing protein [Paenibacillus radicis (ex Gao et al. 2016)]|uniref:ABC transporter domain-containing protein n=1 Tax=Paenibacillus radicis (ex Gao et al. 2016) TaxID=1737354 RepID=A0A917H7A3_9BACL|nr:ABC transporter ATP-binding protein [Paenibacillus radicis (ex Gao et al. 2016)]GGG69431.1 hypothetical protein GCM10010918_25760 [Paenibacillus radicis (ex Gao et al. 2016)]